MPTVTQDRGGVPNPLADSLIVTTPSSIPSVVGVPPSRAWVTPFVVVTMARSGSSYLQFLLNLHPNVKARMEPLRHCFDTMSDAELIMTMFRLPRQRREKIRAVGVKLLQEQIAGRPFTLKNLLNVEGLRVIVLQRRNQLERLRSDAQAYARQTWSVTSRPDRDVPLPSVRLDPVWTLWWLRTATAFYIQLAENIRSDRRLWLFYEDLAADQNAALEPVWDFLGVPFPGSLDAQTYRQESRSLSVTISNYDEISAALTGTAYESLVKP